MADHATLTNMLPNDLWEFIASFLEEKDLATFKQLCQATLFAGFRVEVGGFLEEGDLFSFRKETGNYDKPLSDSIVTTLLQPLYNRLRAMDDSLPALLPQEGALAFKKAFAKIHKRQQEEIAYLTHGHPFSVKVQDVRAFQLPASLKALEDRNLRLDEINSRIIKSRIYLHVTVLNLNDIHLTRLPVTLFQEEEYVLFWQHLTHLYCSRNQLTSLNVQGLMALQGLYCNENQLTSLNVQGLAALQILSCGTNQLTSLNVQGLKALQDLQCRSNQLTSLDIQGLAALGNLDITDNLLSKLDAQGLRSLRRLWCHGNQFTELNLQGLVSLDTLFLGKVNLLETLNLTGVPEIIKNQYGELEQSLLAKKLKQTDAAELTSPWARPIIFSTQNEENQTKDKSNNKRNRDENDTKEKNPKRPKKG